MTVAVILAGGNGTRMNIDTPKQYIMFMGKTILEYTMDSFQECDKINSILLVNNSEYSCFIENIAEKYSKVKWIVPNGSSRPLSVLNAVSALSDFCRYEDKIIFTDGVRPYIKPKEIEQLFYALDYCDCATAGVISNETIMAVDDNNKVKKIIPRQGLFRQVSPEGYKYGLISKLYAGIPLDQINSYKNIGCDEFFERGYDVRMINSSTLNFKITTQDDLLLFESYLKTNISHFNLRSKYNEKYQ